MESLTIQKNRKEEKVAKIIDKVLTQVFGEQATSLIYRHLEHNYSLKRHEIGERIDIFASGLEDFLRSGAAVIEQKILDDIYSSYGLLRRLELEKSQDDCDFVGQMRTLMRSS